MSEQRGTSFGTKVTEFASWSERRVSKESGVGHTLIHSDQRADRKYFMRFIVTVAEAFDSRLEQRRFELLSFTPPS